jgi:integrase
MRFLPENGGGMASKRLTDTSIKSAIEAARSTGDGRRSELRDALARGLVLRVSGTGSAVWYFQFRQSGEPQPIRCRLGPYPDMTLAAARARVEVIRADLTKGIDPVETKRANKAAAVAKSERQTFEEAAEQFIADRIPKEKNRRKIRMTLKKDCYSRFGSKAVEDVTAADIMAAVRSVRARGARTQAKHVFDYARATINHAIKGGVISVSPLAHTSVARESKPRDRVLTVAEIRTLWTRLDTAPLPEDWRIILRLQLLTGQRISEVAGLARHEIDLERRIWTLPAARAKNKHPHVIPLPPMARAIVADRMTKATGRLLFPTLCGNPPDNKHIANGLRSAMPHFGFTNPDGSDAPFTTHDLRRTVATYLRELKFGSDVRDAILNHVSSKGKSVTEMHYNFADISAEMREALTVWQSAIEAIVDGADPFGRSDADVDEIEARALRRFRANIRPLRAVG